MKKYELVYIIHPDLEDTLDKVTDKISEFINKKKGAIIKEDIWGKRKLAYPIKKNDFGIYVLLNFEADPKDMIELERLLNLSEEVIRHLLITVDEDFIAVPEENGEKERAVKKEEDLALELPKEKKEEKLVPEKKEKERLKQLDEKLDELLGKEE